MGRVTFLSQLLAAQVGVFLISALEDVLDNALRFVNKWMRRAVH